MRKVPIKTARRIKALQEQGRLAWAKSTDYRRQHAQLSKWSDSAMSPSEKHHNEITLGNLRHRYIQCCEASSNFYQHARVLLLTYSEESNNG